MKKALIGLANNIGINIEKVTCWSNSFKKAFNGDVILLCANSTPEEVSLCKSLGITCVEVKVEKPQFINHERLKFVRDYLKGSDLDLCIVTDVYDVAFQQDPFVKLDLDNYDIFVGAEGVLVREEPWNCDNIAKIFPNEVHKCVDTEVINSGIICGKREALVNLYDQMYNLCEAGTNSHNIKDQAALILLVSLGSVPRLKIFNLNDSWAVHCAVAGPTQFFESWGFRKTIESRYSVPYFSDNKIYSGQSKLYDIVHQFNRIPTWNQAIKEQNKL